MARPSEDVGQGGFQAVVGLMLEALENIFIESVEVERRPRIALEGATEVELGFELTYKIADRPCRWLIECQRQAGSEEAVRRLLAAKPGRPEGRLTFLYHLDPGLTGDLRRAIKAAGIDHYSLKEFGIRLDEINCALAAASGLDNVLFRLELMKSSREYPALRGAFSRMRVTA